MQYELEEFPIKIILIEPRAVKSNFFENSKPAKNTINSSPCAVLVKKVSEGYKSMFENYSSSPIQLAEVILKSIRSKKADTRDLVGNDAAASMDKRSSSG
jgi:hypothetical protein